MIRSLSILLSVNVFLFVPSAGCSGGKLTLYDRASPENALHGNFSTGVYGFDDRNTLHVLLLEGEDENPNKAVHISMHWVPRAARTPIDERATNASIRYIVFEGDQVGVYAGGGFLFPQSTPGAGSLVAQLRASSLQLEDSAGGYRDALGQASATGDFRAKRDDLRAHRLLRSLQLKLHEKLGYPRLVSGAP
jgi:hypothetical protein